MPSAEQPRARDEIVGAHVRRSPRYGVFLAMGAVAGIVVAMILTFAFDGTALPDPESGAQYSQLQVFGFLALVCIGIGVLVAGLVALLLERIVGRRTVAVTVDHESVHAETDEGPRES